MQAPRQSQQSVESSSLPSIWHTYQKEYEVNFGAGYLWVVSYKRRTRALALIETKDSWTVHHQKNLLGQLRSPSFVQCLEVFDAGPRTHFVLEHMDMSLVQLAVALRFPNEQEIRAIVGQVRDGDSCSHRGLTMPDS